MIHKKKIFKKRKREKKGTIPYSSGRNRNGIRISIRNMSEWNIAGER